MKTRAELIAEARRQRNEITLYFLDIEHWNNEHPEEEPIDPDPDGKLTNLANAIDDMLAREDKRQSTGGLHDRR